MTIMICDRCGCEYLHSNHIRACHRMPTPGELVRRWYKEPHLTASVLRYEYQTSTAFITERLMLGGLTRKEIRQRGREAYANNYRQTIRARNVKSVASSKARCETCDILLGHPKVPAGKNGACGWCISEKVMA